MGFNTDVVVVGAGVVGCSVAYYLSKQGLQVSVLEKDGIGSGASAHATGFLSLLGAEFSPGPSFELGLAGYKEFSHLVDSLEEETGIDLLCQRKPSLRLALSEDEEVLIKDTMLWQEPHIDMHWIDGDEVRKIDSRLSLDIVGGIYEAESTQLDSYRLNLALGQGSELLGARMLYREVTGLITEGQSIIGVKTNSGDIYCDSVVIAAGTWSRMFSDCLRFPIPVKPMKGERLQLKFSDKPLEVLISSPKRGHMISRMDGYLSVGSTGGRDYDQRDLFGGEEFDRIPTENAKIELLQRAIDVMPALEGAELVEQLAGSRPLSPDTKPIIGPVPGWSGVFLATGHTTKGIHLGPITGRIIKDWLVDGDCKLLSDMSQFLPDRFSNISYQDYGTASTMVDE